MGLAGDLGAAAADQEVEVGAAVGLEDVREDGPKGLSLPMVQVGGTTLPKADPPYTECPSGVGT